MFRLTVFVVAGAIGVVAVVGGSDIPPPRAVDVATIVKQLGSEDFAEREAASRRLATLNVDEVPPELLAALKSESPEVRTRAAKAVRALREHIALMRLPRGDRFAKRGQIDLYIASTAAVSRYKADDDRLWIPAYEAGVKAVTMAEMTGDRKPQGPTCFADFSAYKKANPGIEFVRCDGPYKRQAGPLAEAIQASGFTEPTGVTHCLVVSRGPLSAGIMDSLVLATGDVSSEHRISNSVVICDGDVQVKSHVLKSLIISRGKITIGGTVEVSTLIAGGTITIADPPKPLEQVANPLAQKEIYARRVVVEEKVIRPLGYITFLELSTVGVEVKAADRAVTVAKVAAASAAEKAGLKVGDVVLEVSGKKPTDAEALRRLLRDALAIGDATVKLQRGDTTTTVKVSLPE